VDVFAGMSAAERQRTGLDQLTPAQRQALNAWLLENGVPAMEAAQKPKQADANNNDSVAQPAESTISAADEARIQAEVKTRVAEKLAKEKTERLGRENKAARQPVSARIAGDFKGWRGATEFTLDNGQVWKQVDAETYYLRTLHNPEVELVPMALGSWGLRLKATGRTVKVRRIR
jgi:hypothetical protein